MPRDQNLQPIAWFWDLHDRDRLDLDPPYQRRSVWNQPYRDSFIDTVLLDYPAPAIFLFEDLGPNGIAKYSVVDGKQRLTTIFSFVNNEFPVSDEAEAISYRGKYFSDFSDDEKRSFWGYRFLVEYLKSFDSAYINNVFNRINRNVSKLTAQELRHARFDGEFITQAEKLSEWMLEELPRNFPRIASSSRSQMKDVELIAHILLGLELGPSSFSQTGLDEAFAKRDVDWEPGRNVEDRFRSAVRFVAHVLDAAPDGDTIKASKLQNQADFYSLILAVDSVLERGDALSSPVEAAQRLARFISLVSDERAREDDDRAKQYFEDSRSASNDKGPRSRRVETVCAVLRGE